MRLPPHPRSPRRHSAAATILSTALVLAACGTSAEDNGAFPDGLRDTVATTTESAPPTSSTVTAAPTTSPTTATPTTTIPTTAAPTTTPPTTAAPTTRPDKPTLCPTVPPLPGDATDVSRHAADPDGDGEADELVLYLASGRWHMRANLASGTTIDAAITAPGTTISGRPFVGAHDLDRDGDDELFTRAGSGAAAELVALWDLEGCNLAAVTLDGEPAVFPIATSVAAVTGLSCSRDHVDHLYFTDLTSRDGQLYEGTIAAFDLVNGRLVDEGGEGAAYDIATLQSVVGLRCGSLAFT